VKPDADAINSEAKLIMSRIIARRIAADPGIVNRGLAWYADWPLEDRATKPAVFWIETLEQGPEAVRRRLTARDEQAYWMRGASPLTFAHDLDCLRDVEFRRRIWRDAKRLVAMRMRRDLKAFSQGMMSRSEAIQRLGVSDYAELLVALGEADLRIPMPREAVIEEQAKVFVKFWKK
jgi:hypothetical protein